MEETTEHQKEEDTRAEWLVKRESDTTFNKELVEWIKSINSGFKNKTRYEPFERYKAQAKRWAKDELFRNESREELIRVAKRERQRISDNSLYFFNRYVLLKEGDSPTGYTDPEAFEPQAIVCFLFDNHYNIMIGKPRQIGATSVILPIALKRTICRKGYFVKFICENLEKVTEIFNDKLKFPFFHLPPWMKPSISNDRENMLRFAYKAKKGEISGADSKISIMSPTITAINGGSPNLVLIDEAGNIELLQDIMDEGRPTLFWFNPVTKKLEMKRQIVAWGTAGAQEGSEAFENMFRALLDKFEQEDYTIGIIPLFFDTFAKEGMDEAELKRQEQYYLTKKGGDHKKSLVRFRQHFPRNIDDMFVRNSETLIPYETIMDYIDKIRATKTFQWGYFEPILDYGRKMPDNFPTPYAVIGATFIPVNDEDSYNAPICIYQMPDDKWRNRYYQGTDPIASKSGHSKMASAIWDAHENTISAALNFRVEDYRQCFIQSICLGIFYDPSCKELLESNIGSEYYNLRETFNLHYANVLQSELPSYLQLGGSDIGINKRAANKDKIINKAFEVFSTYGDNIHIEEVFQQLRTFVKKIKVTATTFEPSSRLNFDDLIDAVTYAYVCRTCYPNILPKRVGDEQKKKLVTRYACDASTGWRMIVKKKYV